MNTLNCTQLGERDRNCWQLHTIMMAWLLWLPAAACCTSLLRLIKHDFQNVLPFQPKSDLATSTNCTQQSTQRTQQHPPVKLQQRKALLQGRQQLCKTYFTG